MIQLSNGARLPMRTPYPLSAHPPGSPFRPVASPFFSPARSWQPIDGERIFVNWWNERVPAICGCVTKKFRMTAIISVTSVGAKTRRGTGTCSHHSGPAETRGRETRSSHDDYEKRWSNGNGDTSSLLAQDDRLRRSEMDVSKIRSGIRCSCKRSDCPLHLLLAISSS